MTVETHDAVTLAPLHSAPARRLAGWGATAICGKDIYMFIGSPSGRFPYRIAQLGGVRLII